MTDIERYVEKAARAAGDALCDVTVIEGGEEYVEWAEWHACARCPYKDRPCPCSGEPYAPGVARAVLAAVYADIRRDVGEEIREAIFQAADAVIPSGEYAHGATNGLIQAAIIARTVGTGREEI